MSQAGLIDIEASNPQIPTQFDGDSGSAVPLANVLTVEGGTVANATNSKPLFTTGSGNTITAEIQVGSAITGAPGDKNDAGLVSFNDTQFSVDGNGYVSILGGELPIDSFSTDVAGPVSADGSGDIDITGTNIYTDGTVANTITVNVQASENTFLLGAGSQSPMTELGPLSNGQLIIGKTASSPVIGTLDSSDGSITITNGLGTIDLSVSASDDAILTLTGDSGGALSPSAGNVNILGGPGVTITGSGSTLTINSVVYTNQGGSTSVVSDSGSFSTAALTLTLPASPSQGERCEFIASTADALAIQAAGTQVINIGSSASSAGGTATTTGKGDAVTLIYQSTSDDWFALNAVGVFVLA